MKFLELDCDPWRDQPVDADDFVAARMPIDDTDAFAWYPEYRWVYDKLRLCQTQQIECGTSGVEPGRYPVFCKPITNLKGMGAGCCVLFSERDHRENCGPGDFWMRQLSGEHVSTDLAVVGGEAAWCRHTLAMPGGNGTFDYWVIEERPRPRLERVCREWLRQNLGGYTGMVNMETIGGRIISVHLRAADQWSDLYGRKWFDSRLNLYHSGTWALVDNDRAEGYSVVLFGPHGLRYRHPDPKLMADLRSTVGISSIQLTFSEDGAPSAHAMPPGGFRLAVINAFNLTVALRVRGTLAGEFNLPQPGQSQRFAG